MWFLNWVCRLGPDPELIIENDPYSAGTGFNGKTEKSGIEKEEAGEEI